MGIFAALAESNTKHAPAYGNDIYTEQVKSLVEREFGAGISAHLVLTGTAANVIAVATLLQPGETALCAETAHVYSHEKDVHEKFSGTHFLLMPTEDGKITAACIEKRLQEADARQSAPRLLVITNATEYGTVYTPQETQALVTCANRHGMRVLVDGARLANAAATLNLSLADMTINCGIDALSLGGTKNGLPCGEILIFKDGEQFANRAQALRKLGIQDASKMRFIAAQFQAYLHNDLWRKIALQANNAALLLANELRKRDVRLLQKPEANHVWVDFPHAVAQAIVDEQYAYQIRAGQIRLVTSWDTKAEDVQEFMKWLDQQTLNPK